MELGVISEFDVPGLADAIERACPGACLLPQDVASGGAPSCDVLLASPLGSARVAAMLAAPGLRWVHVLGTGVDAFPLQRVPPQVMLSCSRGASGVPIAEWVLAMMLAFEKRLPQSWISAPPAQMWRADLGSLAGRTLGLAGLGGIGMAVARRAAAFDMRVLALARSPREAAPAGVEMVSSREALLECADHLVLGLPLTPATRHFIDAGALARVKPGVHLVNVARGALVDQDALRAALDDGRVACASLDVVEPEPLPEGHWMYAHPRVRLSPHVSWSAPQTFGALLEVFLDNLGRFARGEPLRDQVDRAAGY